MFLDHKFGYEEGQDYRTVPGYEKLSEQERAIIFETYANAYASVRHMGMKVATGKAFESAKVAIRQALKQSELRTQAVPPSIFIGLDNCM